MPDQQQCSKETSCADTGSCHRDDLEGRALHKQVGFDVPFSKTFPIEVWERVIDHLWVDPLAVGGKDLAIRDRKQVAEMRVMLQRDQYLKTVIKSVHFSTLEPLGPFAVTMAGKLRRLEDVHVGSTEWKPGMVHADAANVFLFLSTFTSITKLTMSYVKFPSVATFGRLICSLPRLSLLTLFWVSFTTKGYKAGTVLSPKDFVLEQFSSNDCDDAADVFDCLHATRIATKTRKLTFGLFQNLYTSNGLISRRIQQLLEASGELLTSIHLTFYFGVTPDFTELVSFKHNTKLEILTLDLVSEWDAQMGALFSLLLDTSPSALREIRIAAAYMPNYSDCPTNESLFVLLDPHVCALIDRHLSASAYKRFKVLSFELLVSPALYQTAGGEDRPTLEFWEKGLGERFPRLKTAGSLQ
ncbi:uncharacterized protein FIBRA_09619 [Fibroporia radiculosa]|uniref:F-box domain-containing protein n=1 Tax=Fibroporia radiculosa TaxID=599839 RepID=J4ICC0_9APHY|nr:uncharacterized protein FIBRA_09619 [Fibroporia radiculosa]CCM06146.1 predicted protein [Fibroporia radiculosa]